MKTYFKNEIKNDAIKLEYQEYEICLTPITEQAKTDTKASLLKEDGQNLTNQILYPNAFGNHTKLVYTTGYSGLKEDIILDTYTGQSEFTFRLNCSMLTPKEENRGINFYQGETVVMSIPPVFMQDSSGEYSDSRHFSMDNTMRLSQCDDGTYLLTVAVDESFLTDSQTVYPVTIDPYIRAEASSMQDAPVYSNRPDIKWGNEIRNCVGYDPTVGTGYFYVKCNTNSLGNIAPDRILSAQYVCRELTGYEEVSVVETYMPWENWDEKNVTWNTRPSYFGAPDHICKVNVSSKIKPQNGFSKYWYSFYITQAVIAWKQGVPNYGLLFKEKTSSSWKAFGSKESTYPPYMMVTYAGSDYEQNLTTTPGLSDSQEYYIKNRRSGKYLTADNISLRSNLYQTSLDSNKIQKWRLSKHSDGYYSIYPVGNWDYCLDIQGGGDANENNVHLWTRHDGNNQRFQFVRNWNGTYHIIPKISANRAIVVKQASMDNNANVFLYDYTADYMYNDDWTLEPVYLGTADFFSFTNSGGYDIDTTEYIRTFMSIAKNIGYPIQYDHRDASAEDGYWSMQTAGMFYFTGHGSPSRLSFHSKIDGIWEDSHLGAFGGNDTYDYYVSQLPENSLNYLNLAIFSCCDGGLDNENRSSNLVGMTYRRGAHAVIGHTHFTTTIIDNTWMLSFITALQFGYTISEAMDFADDQIYKDYDAPYGNLNQRHFLGDGNIRFTH